MAEPARTTTDLHDVRDEIGTLRIGQVTPRHRRSAVNLAHYWGIRQTISGICRAA